MSETRELLFWFKYLCFFSLFSNNNAAIKTEIREEPDIDMDKLNLLKPSGYVMHQQFNL